MSFIENINSPDDLKKLESADLPVLAEEIRALIVETVSKNGGHLASNLGVIELSIALHYIYNVPSDKIVWDVGHQAYTHKILTGRRKNFHTLRQMGGVSGFPKIHESPYDSFTTGHSSTSISAGFGMACGKHINNENGKVISIIGDGSLTGGLAYEGLNQAGNVWKNQLVILNDNEMSISKNVGSLSSFLSRTFSAKYMQDLKNEFKRFFKALPKIGDDIYQIVKKSEESFKSFVTPGMLFEAFDYEYMGPIDGHNLDHLISILENIKKINKPVLLHVMTQKGKGYAPAEENPVYFHGVGSFEIQTGDSTSPKKKIPSYTEVFGNTMMNLAKDNSKVVAITAAMPEGTGLIEFSETYPDRFFDVGIAEQHGVTFSAGLAIEGLKPVVAIYSTFLQRAYDQILHDICIEKLPVVFAIDRGGIVGEDGPTHHGLFDYSFLRSMPGMVIMAPKDENELVQMLKTAVDYDKGPVAIRYPRGIGEGVELEPTPSALEIGQGEVLIDGNDILLLAAGSSVPEALSAQKELAKENINAAVINARFIKPLDHQLIKQYAEKTGAIITIEEHVVDGGFGSAVLECLSDHNIYNIKIKRIGIKDQFVEHGSQNELRKKYKIDATEIISEARKLLKKNDKE